ncbi:U3 small nucleolar RNA-associated protein 11 [Nannizzia gypsea CBS 118893]|uniref:U3 small nucleolar RNA-associated protein 11 n=1 Tax=Arthroderma gypseum (strain ATCC MYA-4604 / CBS 118893) TaxID=535722 RepID=E5R1H4_ARTGP|nr:U3 small nucleolar RNA-associated protein 11 [Nannizzia gypsea CBS 118893]EFQ98510.1 U3 small nucleolar RNA-associated protein 11 [Nannizzia gypsea CBS 118893]
MSSMRNAVQRRVHRERAQPAAREKWGLLEKHKDYSLRAKDYNLKKAQLQRLREKARDRNPDEFAYGMMSERSKTHGKHGARESKSLSHATVSLLKTQDAGYLRVVGERVRRQLAQTEEEADLQKGIQKAETLGGKKVIFVDSVEEQQQEKAHRDEQEDDEEEEDASRELTADELKQMAKTMSKKQLEAEKRVRKELFVARRLKEKAVEARLKKLETLKQQHADISAAEEELALQRAKMARSVGGVNKNGVKWKVRERKK